MWKARLLPGGRFGLNKNALNTMRVGIGAATDDDTVIAAQWKDLEDVRFRGRDILLRSADPSHFLSRKATCSSRR